MTANVFCFPQTSFLITFLLRSRKWPHVLQSHREKMNKLPPFPTTFQRCRVTQIHTLLSVSPSPRKRCFSCLRCPLELCLNPSHPPRTLLGNWVLLSPAFNFNQMSLASEFRMANHPVYCRMRGFPGLMGLSVWKPEWICHPIFSHILNKSSLNRTLSLHTLSYISLTFTQASWNRWL